MLLWLAMSANAITTVPLIDMTALEPAVSVKNCDPLDRPVAYTNAAGQAFRLSWDAQGRLLAATNALGEEVQRLAYDAAGNLVERVDGAGRSAVFSYDSLNRATNAAYSDGTNLSFSFDAAGSLNRAVGPGATNTFGYGADGALASSTSTAGGVTFEVRYLRDLAGNVTNLTYPDGRRVAYDFDAENRLAEVRDWNGRVYRFGRDGAGRVTEVAFPNGVSNAWTRDQAGRVTGWSYEKSGTALVERNFTLDAVGRILDADYAAGPQPVFPATRRLDFAHNAADRITASGVYSGTNAESSVWMYDGAGAVTNGGGRSYAYGARGLLERAWGTNVDFEAGYDALGNRIWERSGGVERRFAVNYADPFKRPLVETDALGTVVRHYVWGPDRLLAVEEADGTLRVALTDERGSVAGLTDASGALTDTFVYGPYGEDWGRTGTNALAFRWLGGYGVRHAGGSLYVTRFRAYDADARRFLSADPLGLAGGGNLYAYGAGDPMFFVDPLGLNTERYEDRSLGISLTRNSLENANWFLNIFGNWVLDAMQRGVDTAYILEQQQTSSDKAIILGSIQGIGEVTAGSALLNALGLGVGQLLGNIPELIPVVVTTGPTIEKIVEQGPITVLKDGFYEVNGLKFSQYYYEKLWTTGREAPSLVANEILASGAKGVPDAVKAGFYRYVAAGWELVYNPATKEVWHLQPTR
jgi:RHS repeat-associated protein